MKRMEKHLPLDDFIFGRLLDEWLRKIQCLESVLMATMRHMIVMMFPMENLAGRRSVHSSVFGVLAEMDTRV